MSLHHELGLEIERREKVDDRVKAFNKWADAWRHHAKRYNGPSIQHTWDCAWHARQTEIDALTAEVEEQARLLGTSGSREAELLARIEALTKQCDDSDKELIEALSRIEALREALTWQQDNFNRLLLGKPIRDADEMLARTAALLQELTK